MSRFNDRAGHAMSRFNDRRDRFPAAASPQSTRIDLAGHTHTPLEKATVIRAYLRPPHTPQTAATCTPAVGDDPPQTHEAPTVQLRLNTMDLNTLLRMACHAPPVTVLDELSGCFYDISFTPATHQQLVACATFSRRNEA